MCCIGGGPGGSGGPGPAGPRGSDGDPVDLYTGRFIYSKTDLYVPGVFPISISRYYRSGDTNLGLFGKSSYFEYDWWLGDYGDHLLLIRPGNYQYEFVQQPDGTYINTTDPAFRGAAVTYDPATDTRTLWTKDGMRYTFAYAEKMSGELIGIADRNGNWLSFTRTARPATGPDHGGYMRQITTSDNRSVTFNQTFIVNGNPGVGFFRTDSVTDHTSRTVYYTYETDPFSPFPRLRMVTYPDGGAIQYEYDTAGRMSGFINERGFRKVFNEYDMNNRVIRQTHIDGGVYTFDYVISGDIVTETSMTSPNTAVTTWHFNSDGYITDKTTPDGTTIYQREPGTNLILSVTDPLGRTMSYTYDDMGRVETTTDNASHTTTYTYEDTFSKVTSITDAVLNLTTMTYDASGNLWTVTTPDLKTTTFTYNALGKPLTVTDPANNTTTMTYDASGNLTSVTDPLSNMSEMEYDNLGRLVTMTDAREKSTTYTYDAMGRIATVTDPLGFVTRYTYYLDGKLHTVTDAKDHVITYEYDNRSRLSKMTDQLGNIETYSYDTSDNLTRLTDRKGQTMTYTYDLMNRLKKATYHDGSYTEYFYDTGGRLYQITDSVGGTISYTYTGSGCSAGCSAAIDKVEQETTPLGSISYTYDAVGKRTSMTVAGQPAVIYGYDGGGRLQDMDAINNGVTKRFTIGYDGLGRRASVSLPNGVTTNYGYDNGSRLVTLDHLNPLNQTLESLTYTYDPAGNRTRMNRQSAVIPLPREVAGTVHNNANQMLEFTPVSAPTKTMTYDANGNMTSVTTSCGTTTFTWDVRNRLIAMNGFSLASALTCNPLVASFKYDALGRRTEKTINGRTIQYLYDGLDIVQEIENGAVTVNYVRTLNIDEPLARVQSNGVVRYYQTDALGSVIGLTDETGIVVTQYTYDPFGNTTMTGEMSDNPFQYTGRENDGTGLYYYRARYYSPELQRFVSEDPIGLLGGINMHAYVSNNPVMLTDPTGLVCGSWWNDWLVPDKWPTYDFTACCQEHDDCYGCLGKQSDFTKSDCDEGFCRCMLKQCEKTTGDSKRSCEGNAKLYCSTVKKRGGGAFERARK